MSEPIVFISRNRVKKGKLDDFKHFYQEGVERLRREKPGTVLFLAYTSDDGAESRSHTRARSEQPGLLPLRRA